MTKKMVIGLLVSILAVTLAPATGMCWRGGPSYNYRYYGHGYYRHYYGSDAWVWGLGGLMLGSVLVAAAMQPPPPQVVYVEPSPPRIVYSPVAYSYQPRPAQGECRWERYVLDGYGRTVFDRYGQPIKEYTTGPCNYPPPR
ncbi:MAG: hypothetical protein FWF31_07435 [Desulfobulbus sp.]|nr:hypothetical protein [Desulfobulbus sp.]